ncbi:hypothetical protein QBC47DRAFT_387883 [Echria macrotheca]|uniref:Isopropanol dehydrogenase n=1 Tax=Echria macrotheca TaxID=438768 RepID=A0AAJ0B9Y8_9PEZI|nr:hypothetical protein QBC47DRAFT_387883 [Echria macrotheca]
MASSTSLPPTMKAAVKELGRPGLEIKTVPTPEVLPGTVICKILANYIGKAALGRFRAGDGPVLLTHPSPMVPGGYTIGRVAATSPDTTKLQVGQLVLLEPFIRGRDDSDVQILWGAFEGPSPASKKLAADVWRNGTMADYARAPLENTWALDEARLCGSPADGGLGYAIPELVALPIFTVPFGGLRSVDLKAGETVVVSPATGHFSLAAVAIATAMGARVVAVSRNADGLKRLQEMFPLVVPTGDVAQDTGAIIAAAGGYVDVFAEISPPAAVGSTHIESCMSAVRQYGRICLMGGRMDPKVPISMLELVFKNITIRGSYMYEREHVKGLIKLAESGALKLGKAAGMPVLGEFPLENFEAGLDMVEKHSALDGFVAIV